MDGSRFDTWTRRRFGLAAGGLATALLGLVTLDDLEARKKRRRKKKKRKKKPNVCAGFNTCQELSTCQRPSSEVFCFCFVTAQSGKPFCATSALQVSDCSECEATQACVDLSGDRCGNLGLGCADPCPTPL
jgi:hypothetical protein